MKRALIAAAAALVLAGCGDDRRPVPEHGLVTDANFTPAGVTFIPGMPGSCSGAGTTMVCSPGTPPMFIPYPDEWRLTITDLDNPDWVGSVEVSEQVYNQCNLRELWPECSREGAGDVRQASASGGHDDAG
ncbi:hypothetical protein I5G58_gp094 [Mycobacterium phage BirdsNest]|uniref:Lipoprotein n=1 Tax=Mycobacterium phage BirdsNest TaxID=2686231 RepID=A0A6B9L712_9CAUD|nr:hypothetical protein I5G58_gp094 [Mycobacterium phage BirdsNest]QHB37396.1 hypothetical protein PBI_BIRDSNEST_94 [Mycobacterium phage BirdsNest]